jgi:hypothetical protein
MKDVVDMVSYFLKSTGRSPNARWSRFCFVMILSDFCLSGTFGSWSRDMERSLHGLRTTARGYHARKCRAGEMDFSKSLAKSQEHPPS